MPQIDQQWEIINKNLAKYPDWVKEASVAQQQKQDPIFWLVYKLNTELYSCPDLNHAILSRIFNELSNQALIDTEQLSLGNGVTSTFCELAIGGHTEIIKNLLLNNMVTPEMLLTRYQKGMSALEAIANFTTIHQTEKEMGKARWEIITSCFNKYLVPISHITYSWQEFDKVDLLSTLINSKRWDLLTKAITLDFSNQQAQLPGPIIKELMEKGDNELRVALLIFEATHQQSLKTYVKNTEVMQSLQTFLTDLKPILYSLGQTPPLTEKSRSAENAFKKVYPNLYNSPKFSECLQSKSLLVYLKLRTSLSSSSDVVSSEVGGFWATLFGGQSSTSTKRSLSRKTSSSINVLRDLQETAPSSVQRSVSASPMDSSSPEQKSLSPTPSLTEATPLLKRSSSVLSAAISLEEKPENSPSSTPP